MAIFVQLLSELEGSATCPKSRPTHEPYKPALEEMKISELERKLKSKVDEARNLKVRQAGDEETAKNGTPGDSRGRGCCLVEYSFYEHGNHGWRKLHVKDH